MKKHILIKGYWHTNFGDDALLDSFFGNLKRNGIDSKQFVFHIFCSKADSCFYKKRFGVKTHFRDSFLSRVVNRIGVTFFRNPDLLEQIMFSNTPTIYLIGSGFIQNNNNSKNYFPLKKIKNHFFIIGSNFGPFFSKTYLQNAFLVFEKADSVIFRDSESASFFAEKMNVSYTTDLVFSLEIPQPTYNDDNIVIFPFGKSKFSNNTDYLLYLDEFEIFLTSFQKRLIFVASNKIEGDIESCEYLSNKFPKSEILIYNGYNYEKILKTINESKLIISSRHHGCLTGLLCKKQVIVFQADKKTHDCLKTINLKTSDYQIKIDCLELNRLQQLARKSFDDINNFLINKISK